MIRYADMRVDITVKFDDEDDTYAGMDLKDAAHDALSIENGIHIHTDGVMGIEIVGEVRDTEMPTQN